MDWIGDRHDFFFGGGWGAGVCSSEECHTVRTQLGGHRGIVFLRLVTGKYSAGSMCGSIGAHHLVESHVGTKSRVAMRVKAESG